ncbi:LolA-like protein [Pontibacter mangrovi]|uniref:Outer membrane lipoprotein-sorting protein n=1 Tax=Pontibacter mangrovi TaxID=2589816 RepID=A0A501WKD2_9BACT|nr:outer membrane lipoprotein-sorting protein [Pontibacter mangrovi]TPE46096.1 outer membrane lipoprotein-sorting protein [Pontibacter mangrovi]
MKKQLMNAGSVLLLCLGLLPLLGCATSSSHKYKSGHEVVKAMHERWQGKWYPNFQFEQRAIFYENDKVMKEEVWQELYSQPGQLHIRFGGFDSGNGVIFSQDSVYQFKNDSLARKAAQIHPLVLLCFDVYFYQPKETVAKLQQLQFDLDKLHETEWQGRKVYVVGASSDQDTSSNRFWVDKERLYVLRVVTNHSGTVRDVEINNYQEIEHNWVATEIVFKTDGKTTLKEEYFNISFPAKVNSDWFEPDNFPNTRW